MKRKVGLSGVYLRVKNDETGKFDSIVFEDLSEEEQDRQMENKDSDWIKSLVKILANTINDLSNQFEITSN